MLSLKQTKMRKLEISFSNFSNVKIIHKHFLINFLITFRRRNVIIHKKLTRFISSSFSLSAIFLRLRILRIPTGLNTFFVVGLRACGEYNQFEFIEVLDRLETLLLL